MTHTCTCTDTTLRCFKVSHALFSHGTGIKPSRNTRLIWKCAFHRNQCSHSIDPTELCNKTSKACEIKGSEGRVRLVSCNSIRRALECLEWDKKALLFQVYFALFWTIGTSVLPATLIMLTSESMFVWVEHLFHFVASTSVSEITLITNQKAVVVV